MSALALVTAALSAPIGARSALAAESWTFASSDHFEVYTTGGERRAREALTYFERVHAFFADYLQLEPKAPRPTRLIVFSGARQFEPYRFNEFATAYYVAGPDRDYIVMQSLDADAYPVVVHEYAHLIARHAGAAYPPWLGEGIAEFFSTLAPDGGEMTLGQVPAIRLQELRTGGRWLDLDRLFDVTHASPEYSARRHAGMFYAQSWALTHMIVASDAYRPNSGQLLAAVAGGIPPAEALASVYGKTLSDVSRDLAQYVRNGRFPYFRLKYRDPKMPTTFPTRPATQFEAGLVGANLLAERPDRKDAARAAYEALARERSDAIELVEARAIFEARHGQPDVAERLLSKAVEAKSRNPAIYRWAAAHASTTDEQESLLHTAVGLVPDDIAVRLAYASALMLRRDAAAARSALASIERIPPEHAFRFFELHAVIAAELGDVRAARAAALQAKPHAQPGRETAHIEDVLLALDEHDAARGGTPPPVAPGGRTRSGSRPAPATGATSDSPDAVEPGVPAGPPGRVR